MDIGTRDAKPVVALAMGDPAGISPELTAKAVGLVEVHSKARLIVAGDRRVFNEGMRIAAAKTDVKTVAPDAVVEPRDGEPIFIDLANLDPASIGRGVAAREGGQFALENYRYALGLARDGRVDAVCFTPFNKKAMRLAHPSYDDEIAYSAEVVGPESSASEFNILDKLWNARVTSHIPLVEVPARLTKERILRALKLTDACMRSAGFACPRIAVAGLNLHAGDGGNFEREEIDVIAPAVEAGKRECIFAEGPFPADTVFLRAQKRRVRCSTDNVPRSGSNRDEANGFRSRRDSPRWVPFSDLHTGAWHSLRHRRPRNCFSRSYTGCAVARG
jgi:4-hydroxythreonine-4-phosphate dehydrogenase